MALPSEADEYGYFDHLVAEGDLDRIVGYVVRKRTKERVADLKRRIAADDLGEMLRLADERSPGLDRTSQVALALILARSEIGALKRVLSGDAEPSARVRSFSGSLRSG